MEDDKFASKFFSEKAKTWDHAKEKAAVVEGQYNAISRFCAEQLGTSCRFLDFGCGTGNISIKMAPHVKEVVALDTSPGMLDQFKQKLEQSNITNVRVECMDVLDFANQTKGNPDEGFDVIFSGMTIHHLEDPAAVIKKLSPLLKKNGTFALFDLLKDGKAHLWHKDAEGDTHEDTLKKGGIYHDNGFDPATMNSIFASSGEMSRVVCETVYTVDKNGTEFNILGMFAWRK